MNDDVRNDMIRRYEEARARSSDIFERLTDESYYRQPIPLRHPFVFYEGHLPAFNVNTLIRKALGREGVDARLEDLFERGIDPDSVDEAEDAAPPEWPAREEVLEYAAKADAAIVDALEHARLDDPANPLLVRAQAVHTIIEHELMHHETLRFMLHQLPFEEKERPAGANVVLGGDAPASKRVTIPAGYVTVGANRDEIPFGWDNEFEAHRVETGEFEVDVHPVTNHDYLEFVESGGHQTESLWRPEGWRWIRDEAIVLPHFWERIDGKLYWRGMWRRYPLPPAWPVWVSGWEADAYARWKGGRLMTEAEYHRAAFSTRSGGERPFPWGDEPPDRSRGNFGNRHDDPVPVGSYPGGRSAFGVEDLVGNGWEWTSSRFSPFPGFEAMASYPPYSTDFFDADHWVLKGASPATPIGLIRRSFRNWFRPGYPYVYAKFRVVTSG